MPRALPTILGLVELNDQQTPAEGRDQGDELAAGERFIEQERRPNSDEGRREVEEDGADGHGGEIEGGEKREVHQPETADAEPDEAREVSPSDTQRSTIGERQPAPEECAPALAQGDDGQGVDLGRRAGGGRRSRWYPTSRSTRAKAWRRDSPASRVPGRSVSDAQGRGALLLVGLAGSVSGDR